MGGVDILSDTQGVNFGPYLQQVLKRVRENWFKLIPESARLKRGKLAIQFAISKDGKVTGMRLVPFPGDGVGLNIRPSSGDVALDRAVWGAITESNPFPGLPSQFTGPNLMLRLRFYYNPDKSDLDSADKKTDTR
jgi:outer membrane biosynthesis protein TonB